MTETKKRIQLMHDDTAGLEANKNKIPLAGEVVIDLTKQNFKVGNGSSTLEELDYYIPTKTSELENDRKFIQNIGTDIDEFRKVIQIGDDSLYSLTLTAYELDIIGNTSGYLHITNLSDPVSDSDATNKAYVDSAIASAITATLSTAV